MDENQITGSVQYAFGPDGVLVTGPVLMDDPATGKIICACCRVPKSEHSFLTMGPYNFKSQFCLDCERPRPEQPPPSTLGKRGLDTESEPEHTVSKPEVAKKSKGTETDEKTESSGS